MDIYSFQEMAPTHRWLSDLPQWRPPLSPSLSAEGCLACVTVSQANSFSPLGVAVHSLTHRGLLSVLSLEVATEKKNHYVLKKQYKYSP